ncbi:TIR domain-containing protein [Burkholderia sp. WP9]|uniref:toll/interleukin-1 receptor domain-containing protein n=1 Tax=Burkholderia sp. WP9 TaxID=1500263 RepID=UPI00089B71AC|nr:toll/interleukin-1 receptor domain-containing protein [Burkholderia sp. WP9]SED46358.1 TIR domain-containing protein [Burkholderia sp. WP9]
MGSGESTEYFGQTAMRWRVFYSYSHRDSELRDELGKYLAPLRFQGKIEEWHDRKIEPGHDWAAEISDNLKSAHCILLLVSSDFLASEYCFGVEVDEALKRLKRCEARVLPVLLRPCLWEESRFSELQHIPRDGKAVTSWPSRDEAMKEVAHEIRALVTQPIPFQDETSESSVEHEQRTDTIELVRKQVLAYARLYERTRQRMSASNERTIRMEQIFQRMRSIALSSYPLLCELVNSPSPGERLAAVAILQLFSDEQSFPFLINLIRLEKPFVGYQAAKALRVAVDCINPHSYPKLLKAICEAQSALESAMIGFDTDRRTVLREAESLLQANMVVISADKRSAD